MPAGASRLVLSGKHAGEFELRLANHAPSSALPTIPGPQITTRYGFRTVGSR